MIAKKFRWHHNLDLEESGWGHNKDWKHPCDITSLQKIHNLQLKELRGRLVEWKLMLISNFRCDQMSEISFSSHFVVLLKSDLDVQQTHLKWGHNKDWEHPCDITTLQKIHNLHLKESRGRFVEQKLMLISNFRCDQMSEICFRGHIFSHVWPFYERAVSDLDP